MPWIYFSRTGNLYHNDQFITKGYAGNGLGLNNPGFQWLPNKGPLPTGEYKIGKPRYSNKTGAFVMALTPVGHKALGRSAFQIHGDNKNLNFSASSGCIILKRKYREIIADSGDDVLLVFGARIVKV